MSGFSNPIVGGGGALVYPSIHSPNFSVPGQTGWGINKDGSAYFFNVTASGNIQASTGSIGQPGGSQILLNPNVNQTFNVTAAIAGFLQAVEQFITTDGSEVVAGALGALLLGTGSATKMSTALTSAFGNTGAAIILESENDGGTDTPVITFGTVTTPDGGTTVVYAPIASLSPYAFLLYGGTSGTVVVTKTSGSGNIPIPAGVTVGLGESWGGSGGSGGDFGGGGGGGEYAAEPNLALTGGGNAAYVVGGGGTAGSGGGTSGGNGNNSTLTGSAVTVTAHGGTKGLGIQPIGSGGGAGGTGSVNTVHFNGGSGGNVHNGGGGGGGGSGGPSSAGNNGGNATNGAPGIGALAVAGGGAGGNGGNGPGGGVGISGKQPGGGAGGGGGNANGAVGKSGLVRLTYSTGPPPILFSVASAAGTDQFGTAYPAGPWLTSSSGLATRLIGALSPAAFTYLTAGNVSTSVDLASITIPANEFSLGDAYEMTGDGYLISGQTTPETINLRLTVAGTNTGSSTTASIPINTTSRITFTARLKVHAVGVSGSNYVGGSFMVNGVVYALGNTGTGSTAMDTTAPITVAISAIWGGTGGSNQIAQILFASFKRVA